MNTTEFNSLEAGDIIEESNAPGLKVWKVVMIVNLPIKSDGIFIHVVDVRSNTRRKFYPDAASVLRKYERTENGFLEVK